MTKTLKLYSLLSTFTAIIVIGIFAEVAKSQVATNGMESSLSAPEGWVQLNTGVSETVAHLFVKNRDTVYAGTQSYLLRSQDGGTSWEKVLTVPKDEGGRSCVWFMDDTTGIFASIANKIYRTTDGCRTWNVISPLSLPHPIIQMQFAGRDTGWILTSGNILRTTDGGIHWSEWQSNANCFSFANTAVGYSWQIDDQIEKTTDGGSTWRRYPYKGTRVLERTMWALSADTLVAACCGSEIERSLDSGHAWSGIDCGAGLQSFTEMYFVGHRNGWAVSSWSGITHTTDAGASWHAQQNPVNRPLWCVAAFDSLTAYAGGDSGLIIKTVNGGRAGVQPTSSPSDWASIDISPNPANQFMDIEYTLSTEDRISSDILDLSGRVVMAAITDQPAPAGRSSQKLDVGALPSGTYLYRLTGRRGVVTQHFVILN